MTAVDVADERRVDVVPEQLLEPFGQRRDDRRAAPRARGSRPGAATPPSSAARRRRVTRSVRVRAAAVPQAADVHHRRAGRHLDRDGLGVGPRPLVDPTVAARDERVAPFASVKSSSGHITLTTSSGVRARPAGRSRRRDAAPARARPGRSRSRSARSAARARAPGRARRARADGSRDRRARASWRTARRSVGCGGPRSRRAERRRVEELGELGTDPGDRGPVDDVLDDAVAVVLQGRGAHVNLHLLERTGVLGPFLTPTARNGTGNGSWAILSRWGDQCSTG